MYKINFKKLAIIGFILGIAIGFSKEAINESNAQAQIIVVHEEVEIEYINGGE